MKFVHLCALLFLAAILVSFLIACDNDDDDDNDNGDDVADDDAVDDDQVDDDQTDDDEVNDWGLKWVTIPAGQFEMGCVEGDEACDETELPRHIVSLSAFEMTDTPITQSQYQALIAKNPSYHLDCPTCPVEQVTWFEADEFCRMVGGMLPTEAQWEYAARAGTQTITYCGDDAACLEQIAWGLSNSGGSTQPVGLKQPNDFGLYDMVGNVWEWANDWYDEAYYATSPTQDPPGADSSQFRSVRGAGAYNNDADYLRISARNRDMDKDRSRALGFRCVRQPE